MFAEDLIVFLSFAVENDTLHDSVTQFTKESGYYTYSNSKLHFYVEGSAVTV